MKKAITTLAMSLIMLAAMAQKSKTIFIEIRGSVDMLGNISLDRIEASKKTVFTLDSIVNIKELQKQIIQLKDPVSVMNMMAGNGWKFCNSMQVTKDQSGMPNSPFVAYYFSKELIDNQP